MSGTRIGAALLAMVMGLGLGCDRSPPAAEEASPMPAGGATGLGEDVAGVERTERTTPPPAVSKANQPTLRVALVLPSESQGDAYWRAVQAGAVKAARELSGEKQKVQVVWWRSDEAERDRSEIDALVQTPGSSAAPADVPVVMIGDGGGDASITAVRSDDAEGGRLAAEHLGRQLDGRGRVLWVRHSSDGSESDRQFREAMQRFTDIELIEAGRQFLAFE